jgi:uncharacterized delta-60 repeat protein
MVVAKGGKIVLVGQADNASNVSRFAVARLLPDGTPDHTFSGDGRTTLDLGPNSYAYSVLALADGSIVAAGDGYVGVNTSAAIVKYRPNGTLDEDFGEGGSVVNDVGVDFSPSGMVRTSDGKFLLAGAYRTGAATFEVGLMRFRANGKPDVTYGPDGLVTHDFGGESDYTTKIVRVGTKFAVAVGHEAGGDNQLGVVQVLANGGVDNGFGDQGLSLVPTGDQASAGAIARQSDGKLVASGNTGSSDTEAKFLVARFLES